LDGINDFTPAEFSVSAETSESGTTLCSRTARLNLMRMWVVNPPAWWSAKASFDAYEKWAMPFPPEWSNWAKIADLYLDATPKNKQYGHRVAAFEKDWKWFVLDPYYKLPVVWRTRQPIPAETYVNIMTNQFGKKYGEPTTIMKQRKPRTLFAFSPLFTILEGIFYSISHVYNKLLNWNTRSY